VTPLASTTIYRELFARASKVLFVKAFDIANASRLPRYRAAMSNTASSNRHRLDRPRDLLPAIVNGRPSKCTDAIIL
jgi:hypothetical protein